MPTSTNPFYYNKQPVSKYNSKTVSTGPVGGGSYANISAALKSGGITKSSPSRPSGGGGQSVASYGGYSDPYSSAQRSVLNSLPGQLQGIYNSTTDAARTQGYGLDSSIRNWGLNLRQSQDKVNQANIQNESSKKQGTRGVLGMVGRGIQSGGVTLANKNAGTSSAASALANAYGTMGRNQLSDIGNQYELGKLDIQNQQKSLNEQADLFTQHTYGNQKNSIVDSIVGQAQSQLAALDNALAGASLPDRLNIEAEKQKVRDLAAGQLAQFDALLNQERASAVAQTPEQAQSEANRLLSLGQAPAGTFQYTDQAPAILQGQQLPAGSNLPIYVKPKNDQTGV